MKINFKIFLLLMLLVCGKAQAQTVFKANEISPLSAEQAMLSKVFKKQTLVQLNAEAIYHFVKQAGSSSRFIIQAGNLYNWNIDLHLHDMRSPDYLHQVTTAKGLETIPKGECITYAGSLYGNLNNAVRLNIRPGQIDGLIINQGENIFIEPLKHFIKTAPKDRFVIYKRGDVINHGGTCGGGTIAEKSEQQTNTFNASSATTSSAVCRKIEIATEADYECYNDGFDGYDITANLNLVEQLYQTNFGASIIIRYMHEWATSNDPYTSEDVCLPIGSTDRLSQFKDYWNANFSYVPRDVTFMYTGIDFNGGTIGCAYKHSFQDYTDNSWAYGTAQEYFFGVSDGQRQVVIAHEIGHIFGCEHDETGCSEFSPGPIMCPSLAQSCSGGCAPYWSQRSIDSINISMSSTNGVNKFRQRIFNFPNTFSIPATFSGNIFRFSGAYNTVGSGAAAFTIVDSATFFPGFSAVIGAGDLTFTMGSCNLDDGFAPHTISQIQSFSSIAQNKEQMTSNRIKVYPNPFTSFTIIEIELSNVSSVSVSVYDLAGRLVDKPYINKQMAAGKNTLSYTNNKLASNSYLFIIDIDGKRYTEKVIKM